MKQWLTGDKNQEKRKKMTIKGVTYWKRVQKKIN